MSYFAYKSREISLDETFSKPEIFNLEPSNYFYREHRRLITENGNPRLEDVNFNENSFLPLPPNYNNSFLRKHITGKSLNDLEENYLKGAEKFYSS